MRSTSKQQRPSRHEPPASKERQHCRHGGECHPADRRHRLPSTIGGSWLSYEAAAKPKKPATARRRAGRLSVGRAYPQALIVGVVGFLAVVAGAVLFAAEREQLGADAGRRRRRRRRPRGLRYAAVVIIARRLGAAEDKVARSTARVAGAAHQRARTLSSALVVAVSGRARRWRRWRRARGWHLRRGRQQRQRRRRRRRRGRKWGGRRRRRRRRWRRRRRR